MPYGLLVERDESIRSLIALYFEGTIKFLKADNYTCALDLIKNIHFDLIILDLYTLDFKVDIIPLIPFSTSTYLLTTTAYPSDLSVTVISKPFDLEKLDMMQNNLNKTLTM